jgi:hypothetical protein
MPKYRKNNYQLHFSYTDGISHLKILKYSTGYMWTKNSEELKG